MPSPKKRIDLPRVVISEARSGSFGGESQNWKKEACSRIETLEHDIAIVLALYGTFAGADLSLFPPEERRRIYAALGLRAMAYSSGSVEIEIAWAPISSHR
jgi:hypothetical protein